MGLGRKTCFCLMQNSFLATLLAMLISRKPVQRRGIGEKNAVISLLASRHHRRPKFTLRGKGVM